MYLTIKIQKLKELKENSIAIFRDLVPHSQKCIAQLNKKSIRS
jgi:hypothetical protein